MKPLEVGAAMSESLALIEPGRSLLGNLPVSLFGSVMGVAGLSVAWSLAHTRYGVTEGIAIALASMAVVAFVLMVAGYAVKLVTAFAAVKEEFRHPISCNLFGTVLISLLQLPIVVEPFAHRLAQVTWIVGAAGMGVFASFVVSRWMTDRRQVAHASPSSIVPVVGVLYVPVALPALALPHVHGLMVAALAIGLFFAVQLFALIFSRLLFEPPLPAAIKPSLLVLVAPFAVGYSTYTVTVGRTDLFAEALFMLTLFLLVVLLAQLRDLPVSCPLHVSWWSVSFPLAACSIAAIRFANARPGVITDAVAIVLLALATVIIAGLLVRTLVDMVRGESPYGHLGCYND